jgi:hypothetical protein
VYEILLYHPERSVSLICPIVLSFFVISPPSSDTSSLACFHCHRSSSYNRWCASDAKYNRAVSARDPSSRVIGATFTVPSLNNTEFEVTATYDDRYVVLHVKKSDMAVLKGSHIYVSIRSNSVHGTDVELVHDIAAADASPVVRHWISYV